MNTTDRDYKNWGFFKGKERPKDELTRQCEMAWERGHALGRVEGIAITAIVFIIATLIVSH